MLALYTTLSIANEHQMPIHKLSLKGATLIEPVIHTDDRGFFLETYRDDDIEGVIGRPYRFAQGNHSRSQAGVLRGFRCEPWDKLIYVPHGTALIVIADPRPHSPTFRQHVKLTLGDAPGKRGRLLIEKGLANAFYCLTETDYINEVSEPYQPHVRRGFRWDDPDVSVEWPTKNPILSSSDAVLPTLQEMIDKA